MSILVVGSVAYDDIASPSGSVKNILGGAATYFSLAASYFTEVRVVAVVGEDFGADQESVFHRRKIDTRGIERAKGKTFLLAAPISTISTRPKPTSLTSMSSKASIRKFRRNTKTHNFFFWRTSSQLCKPMSAATWVASN